MSKIEVRVVDSLQQEIERTQNKIRVRAYERFLEHADESGRELDDWLTAERELIRPVETTLVEEMDKIILLFDIQPADRKSIRVDITAQDALLLESISDESADAHPSIFAVVRLPQLIDTTGVRAEYDNGKVRLIASIAGTAKVFQKSA